MRFFKRLAGLLGFAKDEVKDEEENDDDVNRVESHLPRKGFSVPVKLAVDRAQLGPILVPCSGDGGVQGFRWHAKRLRIDEDGDVADEFFEEVLPETMFKEDHKPSPRFQLKYSTTPAKVKNQVLSLNGQLQQCVEHRGRLQWV